MPQCRCMAQLEMWWPFLEHLKTPIGLLENSNDPAEIAVSVVAEVLQVHHQHAESSSSRSVTP